jgi:hypothetical protein
MQIAVAGVKHVGDAQIVFAERSRMRASAFGSAPRGMVPSMQR